LACPGFRGVGWSGLLGHGGGVVRFWGRASDADRPPPYRQFVLGCQTPASEAHRGPMILAACYEESPVDGHPERNWALIDLYGTNHGDDRVVLECPTCGRRYIRNATELVEVWEAQGSPKDLWL
jgi:hypothetical protein